MQTLKQFARTEKLNRKQIYILESYLIRNRLELSYQEWKNELAKFMFLTKICKTVCKLNNWFEKICYSCEDYENFQNVQKNKCKNILNMLEHCDNKYLLLEIIKHWNNLDYQHNQHLVKNKIFKNKCYCYYYKTLILDVINDIKNGKIKEVL